MTATLSQEEVKDSATLLHLKKIRPSVMLAGLLLTAGAAYFYCMVETRYGAASFSNSPVYAAPIIGLVLIMGFNASLGRRFPTLSITPQETCALYIMLGVVSVIANFSFLQSLIGYIVYPYWNAAQHPSWQSLFLNDLPVGLYVSDSRALRGFFQGRDTFFTIHTVLVWIPPILLWTGFIMTILCATLGIAGLTKHRWEREERLPYPTLRLPLYLISNEPKWKNKFFLVGFVIPVILAILRVMHQLLPNIPAPVIGTHNVFGARQTLLPSPWSSINWLAIGYEPWAVGLAYLVPLDLSFSIWFFFLLSLAEYICSAMIGWNPYAGPPYMPQQNMGAWLALGCFLIWGLREPLISRMRSLRHSSVLTAPRQSVWPLLILCIGIAGIIAFSQAVGMSGWVALLFFGIYLLLSVNVARIRAEFAPVHMLWYTHPATTLNNLFGASVLGKQNLASLTSFYWLVRVQLANPTPLGQEGLILGERKGLSTSKVIWILLGVGLFAIMATFLGYLTIAYRDGAQAKFALTYWIGVESFGHLETWRTIGTVPGERINEITGLSIGAGIMCLLFTLRRRLAWFPFHPAGYALAMDAAMTWYWFPFFIAWIIKFPILRYLGISSYRKTEALALGLIVGDFLARSIVALISISINVSLPTW